MKRKALGTLLVLFGLGAWACSGDQPRDEQVKKGQEAVVLPNGVLSTNFILEELNSFENTAKVVPPSTRPTANCPNGGIALLTGQAWFPNGVGSETAFRPLVDASGKIDTSLNPGVVPRRVFLPSATPPDFPGTDNQIVRLKDGSLLAMKGGRVARATNPPLLYANQTIDGTLGTRGAIYFYRSTDCGANWTLRSVLDYGTFAGGTYGWPRPLDAAGNAVPCSQQARDPVSGALRWTTGPDRPEMYACPFSGNIYVTEHAVTGPYCPGGPGAPTSGVDTELLIMSNDGGASWSLATTFPPAAPTVMTSTPNGRLFLLSHGSDYMPAIRYSQPVGLGGVPTLSAPVSAPFKQNGVPIRVDSAIGTRGRILIQSDRNLGLAVNASGGAREGAELKLSSLCTNYTNPDCTWAYRNGMLISDTDPTLAVTVGTGAEGTKLTLTTSCNSSKPECTFTYKKGEFFSDKSPTRAMNAWFGAVDGASLVITSACQPDNPDCTFTLPRVEFSSGANASLRVIPNGAVNGAQLFLTDACEAGNSLCTYTFSKGMIKNDANSTMAVNAAGGATNLALVKLSNICSATNPACTWTWSKGELISDGSGATPLPINAFGGAVSGALLKLNSACTAANNDCVFSIHNEAADIDRAWAIGLSLSRLSVDSNSSRVRLAYSSRNADNMLEARIVNFDVANPSSTTSVATIRASSPGNHSVTFPTFVEPDYLDMPRDERTNTAMLYWEEAPTPSAGHTYSTKYVTIDGDTTVSAALPLSVSSGVPRSWTTMSALGDYVNGGFFWRDKTLNYLAHWIEPGGSTGNIVQANVVTLRSPVHGFLIKSDRDATLAFNAAGGAVHGAEIKLSNICTASNPDCTWSYRNGMIVSDRDPTLAINAFGGAGEGVKAKLSNICTPSNPDCTWTYKKGEFLSDRDQSLHLNALNGAVNGASIVLTRICSGSNPDCTFTLPNVELTSAMDSRLAFFPPAGAVNGSQLTLSDTCSADISTNCVFTFSKGMILSGTTSTLALNAAGGAVNLAPVKLSNICTATNTSCLWTWSKGQIISDGSATPLSINAVGGAVPGALLKINSACTSSNNDCVFAGYYMR